MLDFYKAEDKFGYKDGFSIAAGLVGASFSGIELVKDDPTIGQLEIYRKNWEPDYENNDLSEIEFPQLESRPCTREDFNDVEGSNESTSFYKLREIDGIYKY